MKCGIKFEDDGRTDGQTDDKGSLYPIGSGELKQHIQI